MSSPASAPTTPPQLVYPRRLRAGQMDRQDSGTESRSRLKALRWNQHLRDLSLTRPSGDGPTDSSYLYRTAQQCVHETQHDLSSSTRRANEPFISNTSITYTPVTAAQHFSPFLFQAFKMFGPRLEPRQGGSFHYRHYGGVSVNSISANLVGVVRVFFFF